jgi:serine protease Do
MALPAITMPDTASFAALADRVTPAVVHVRVESRRPTPRGLPSFFGVTPAPPARRGVGSGVIVDADGIALTNAHVVQDAAAIEVVAPDGTARTAKLVGADPATDVAVIRIDDARDLPYLALADSDAVKVGDWVMAIGSPFGLQASVTSGIISAKARRIGAGPYDDFLQTDAAINPGNSGGPLIDMHGRVVGINTAIVQGGSGVGFAIPSNMARDVARSLREDGTVTRGWLGVSLQPVTPAVARARGLDAAAGALVADVIANSPAATAGLRSGDVVVRFNDTGIDDPATLARLVAFAKPGETARLTVRRQRDERTIEVRLGEAPDRRG